MTAVAASFHVTGGTLRQAGARSAGPVPGPTYVERQADQELYKGLLAGEFCYVLTSRQIAGLPAMDRERSSPSLSGRLRPTFSRVKIRILHGHYRRSSIIVSDNGRPWIGTSGRSPAARERARIGSSRFWRH